MDATEIGDRANGLRARGSAPLPGGGRASGGKDTSVTTDDLMDESKYSDDDLAAMIEDQDIPED